MKLIEFISSSSTAAIYCVVICLIAGSPRRSFNRNHLGPAWQGRLTGVREASTTDFYQEGNLPLFVNHKLFFLQKRFMKSFLQVGGEGIYMQSYHRRNVPRWLGLM